MLIVLVKWGCTMGYWWGVVVVVVEAEAEVVVGSSVVRGVGRVIVEMVVGGWCGGGVSVE